MRYLERIVEQLHLRDTDVYGGRVDKFHPSLTSAKRAKKCQPCS